MGQQTAQVLNSLIIKMENKVCLLAQIMLSWNEMVGQWQFTMLSYM